MGFTNDSIGGATDAVVGKVFRKPLPPQNVFERKQITTLGNADSCRTGHIYSEIFLNLNNSKNKTI